MSPFRDLEFSGISSTFLKIRATLFFALASAVGIIRHYRVINAANIKKQPTEVLSFVK
jgi:hypothetical protein